MSFRSRGSGLPLENPPPPVCGLANAPKALESMYFRQAQKVNCPGGAREAALGRVLPKMIGMVRLRRTRAVATVRAGAAFGGKPSPRASLRLFQKIFLV